MSYNVISYRSVQGALIQGGQWRVGHREASGAPSQEQNHQEWASAASTCICFQFFAKTNIHFEWATIGKPKSYTSKEEIQPENFFLIYIKYVCCWPVLYKNPLTHSCCLPNAWLRIIMYASLSVNINSYYITDSHIFIHVKAIW